MDKLEKAIFNLDVGIRFVENRGYGGIGAIMSDAISLLKSQQARIVELEAAQQPRVMNEKELDDLLAAYEYEMVVWIEEKGHKRLFTATLRPRNIYRKDPNFYDIKSESYFPRQTIGKTWRPWTSRPTDEQREAVKWDADIVEW